MHEYGILAKRQILWFKLEKNHRKAKLEREREEEIRVVNACPGKNSLRFELLFIAAMPPSPRQKDVRVRISISLLGSAILKHIYFLGISPRSGATSKIARRSQFPICANRSEIGPLQPRHSKKGRARHFNFSLADYFTSTLQLSSSTRAVAHGARANPFTCCCPSGTHRVVI